MLIFYVPPNPFLSEPKSVAARKRNNSFWPRPQPVCSSCHHQQQLPPSADAKRHESSSREFCSQQSAGTVPAQKLCTGRGGKVTKPTGGSLNEWKRSQKDLESFCCESRSLGNELSLRFMPRTFLTTGHRIRQGMEKEKKFLRRLEERRKCREKAERGGKRSRKKRIALFRLFKRRTERDRLPWRPRPERPQPIGRDVGANEKALALAGLKILPGGSVRTGEWAGWLWSGFLAQGRRTQGRQGARIESKCGRPHSLSAEP